MLFFDYGSLVIGNSVITMLSDSGPSFFYVSFAYCVLCKSIKKCMCMLALFRSKLWNESESGIVSKTKGAMQNNIDINW